MLVALLAALTVQAAPPACEGGAYRAFDFWLGSWDVYSGENQVGQNEITLAENGCLLIERWTNSAGGTGQSYNFYNPKDEVWRQVWVSAGLVIDDFHGGLDENGAMVLEGTLVPRSDQGAQPIRGRWMKNDDGTVQQTFWTKDVASGAWSIWFDGNYRRKPE